MEGRFREQRRVNRRKGFCSYINRKRRRNRRLGAEPIDDLSSREYHPFWSTMTGPHKSQRRAPAHPEDKSRACSSVTPQLLHQPDRPGSLSASFLTPSVTTTTSLTGSTVGFQNTMTVQYSPSSRLVHLYIASRCQFS
jgi:hypothetical protein